MVIWLFWVVKITGVGVDARPLLEVATTVGVTV